MSDFLLELFGEEIPARMQAGALAELQSKLVSGLQKAGIGFDAQYVQGYVTPRRMAILIQHLPNAQPDTTTERKGPKTNAPDAAIQGFLKSTGLTLAQLEDRDGVYFATIEQKGRATSDVLKALVEDMLAAFPWPKSMRWGNNDISWVRPLHSVVCLFDSDNGMAVVPVKFGTVAAGELSHGHRFLHAHPIAITSAVQYEALLEKAYVIADRDKRKASIMQQANEAASKLNLQLKKDDALVEEVTGLVEWPVVLVGHIDERFMSLPPEVLTTVMRAHQKYFALQQLDGTLSPHFLIVSNIQVSDKGAAIIAGNERVLRARFSDAQFFWDQDSRKPLVEWADGLGAVTFHAKLGTIADKINRITALAENLTPYVTGAELEQVRRACALCKADLVTGMVGEFAELQGIMGRYYALQQQEAPAVADAIRDHYKPQGPNDHVPTQPVSICVALADKLDTLVSMFAVGEKPTGSKDPFALRRAALGAIRIILENDLRLPLSHVLGDKMENELLAFFTERLKVQLKEQGIRHDVINALVADRDDDLMRIVARAGALQDFLRTDDGANLLVAYRRAANIVAIEEKKDAVRYASNALDSSYLQEAEEIELAKTLQHQKNLIENLFGKEQFAEAMAQLAALRIPVDHFFDKVLVNCEHKPLRKQRLRLLASIKASMDSIANFALIEG